MNRMRAMAVGIVVSSALVCAALAVAQEQQTRPPGAALQHLQATETSRDSRMTGVKVVRLINTAEAVYKSEHGSYASWSELFGSDAISEREKPGTPFQGLQLSAGPEVVPGWNLAIVVSSDQRNYELALRSVDDKQCRFSFFSDDSGLIYQGGVIDCSVQLVPAHG